MLSVVDLQKLSLDRLEELVPARTYVYLTWFMKNATSKG